MQENAPLRAEINGRLCSAPLSLYDDIIRRELAKMPMEFCEARLIGSVLGRNELSISDSFIAQRIASLLKSGELQEVMPDKASYRRILRKTVCAIASQIKQSRPFHAIIPSFPGKENGHAGMVPKLANHH